jgi:hypothetical protein
MPAWITLLLIALGLAALFFGKRFWLLGAATGALLGIGLVRLIPGVGAGYFAVMVVFGLAIVLGILGVVFKGLSRMFLMIVGFIAGGGVVMGVLGSLGISLGFFDFVLALIGALIGLVLVNRFFDWAIIVLAALVGATLTMRGIQLLLAPRLTGPLAVIIGIALLVLGILYQARGKRK